MTVVYLRPVGWNFLTPRQWGALRGMIISVSNVALRSGDVPLWLRAERFLANTEGRDE